MASPSVDTIGHVSVVFYRSPLQSLASCSSACSLKEVTILVAWRNPKCSFDQLWFNAGGFCQSEVSLDSFSELASWWLHWTPDQRVLHLNLAASILIWFICLLRFCLGRFILEGTVLHCEEFPNLFCVYPFLLQAGPLAIFIFSFSTVASSTLNCTNIPCLYSGSILLMDR